MTARLSLLLRDNARRLCSRSHASFLVSKFTEHRVSSVRMLSQAEEARKKNVISIKKRRPRRKANQDPSLANSGFWNVVAVTTAEEYDLESMYKSLVSNESYRISDMFETVYSKDKNFEFLHAIARHKIENENRELFIFHEGSFVAWNISDLEVINIVNFVKNYEIDGYNEVIIKDEMEVMPYTYSVNNNKNSQVHNGSICLTQLPEKCSLDKYSCSNGMVASVKLGVWETLLDKFIETIEPITLTLNNIHSVKMLQDLKNGNHIKLTRKELLKRTGELYALKHKINLSSDLLDTPDFYWEREELERFYLNTCRYFNIPKRTKVINDKINHCTELVNLLSSHLSDKHHIRLEWMIIVLIMVEVGFEMVHFYQIRQDS